MFLEILKALLFGIVEGITEWLPISSTGHMILLDEFIKLDVSENFLSMFLVVIQLGAIIAVVFLFWNKIMPFSFREQKLIIKKSIIEMWVKIVVACIPAAVVGLLFDDKIDELFYHPIPVSLALIIFGIMFIVVERINKGKRAKINEISEITYTTAFIIGICQLIAAVFPGTSRSGATIIGGMLVGMSRTIAAEFTFFLAIPVMFGASLLKLFKFGIIFSGAEISILITGLVSSFVVSIIAIKFLMNYIKKNNFDVFGWYRIVLGVIVILYFAVLK